MRGPYICMYVCDCRCVCVCAVVFAVAFVAGQFYVLYGHSSVVCVCSPLSRPFRVLCVPANEF